MKIFISYTSRDKKFVARLKGDLQSHEYSTWVDEDQILYGGSITEGVERGLDNADVLLACLTEAYVASAWANAEWRGTFSRYLKEKSINIIPLVLDNCKVPILLTDLRQIDFREQGQGNYERGLSELLKTLGALRERSAEKTHPAKPHSETDVFGYTKRLLDDLAKEHVALPIHPSISIVDTLKKIPRSGKKIRLNKFPSPIRIRSVYDHILSVAHTADCLLPSIQHGLSAEDFRDLARCIAYHELNEVILGDIPTFTSLDANKRSDARIKSEERLRSVDPKRRERIANDLIWMFLGERNRRSFQKMIEVLDSEKSRLAVTFRMLDKIDPIIAIWRYLHVYRGRLGPTASAFTRATFDFFDNPDVTSFVKSNKIDVQVLDLVANLQQHRRAEKYYESSENIFGYENFFQLPKHVVKKIIEGSPLFYSPDSAE